MNGASPSAGRPDILPPVDTRPSPAPLRPAVAAFAVFLASGAVLILEIVGLRLVAPYLGVTLQVSSAVIGIALAAIAYGTWTGGWFADRVDPRRLLAPAFLLAAAATAVTLPIVRWAGELLRGSAAGGVLLLAALAVFTPAAFLAAITPLVVKLQLAHLRETGRVVGRLSSLGTLGAITATLLTGFVLVAALPTSVILLSLAAVLAAAGVGLFVASAPGAGPWRSWGSWWSWRSWRSWLAGRSRRTGVMAVVGLVGAGLTTIAPNPCDIETAYHCARVEVDPERPTGRLLLLNSARHSYVDLADPRHLEFAYAQWMGAVVDVWRPGPLRVLHMGGGGFTLPRYVAATRPGSYGRVLELDEALVDLDRARLGVVPGPSLDIVVGDARTSLARQSTGDYDLVIGDAFGHLVVPWHLTTREFVADVRRVLRADGAYALNVIDYPPTRFAKAELATVRAVFPHVAIVAPPAALAGRRGANFVILGSASPLPLAPLRARLATLPEPVTILDGDELARFVGAGPVLTDDYAPVDQLLTFT
jgi:spermidine synthase/MFS family permease